MGREANAEDPCGEAAGRDEHDAEDRCGESEGDEDAGGDTAPVLFESCHTESGGRPEPSFERLARLEPLGAPTVGLGARCRRLVVGFEEEPGNRQAPAVAVDRDERQVRAARHPPHAGQGLLREHFDFHFERRAPAAVTRAFRMIRSPTLIGCRNCRPSTAAVTSSLRV